jgi:hypothetical protein
MQLACVELTLPHESAVVTNTCSNRNEGFSYGFLLAVVRGLSEDESFIAIRGNPICLSILEPLLECHYCNAG